MQIALIISPFSDLKSINTHSSWSPGKCSASGGGWTNGFLDVIGRRDRNGNGWFDLLEFGLEFNAMWIVQWRKSVQCGQQCLHFLVWKMRKLSYLISKATFGSTFCGCGSRNKISDRQCKDERHREELLWSLSQDLEPGYVKCGHWQAPTAAVLRAHVSHQANRWLWEALGQWLNKVAA